MPPIPLERCDQVSSTRNLIPLSATQMEMCPQRNIIDPGQSQSSLVITSENLCGGAAHDGRRVTTFLPPLVLNGTFVVQSSLWRHSKIVLNAQYGINALINKATQGFSMIGLGLEQLLRMSTEVRAGRLIRSTASQS